jgi:hypothetical protein
MSHHHQSKHRGCIVAITMTSLSAVALACSDGEVNLGGGLVAQGLGRTGRCAQSTRIEDDVNVANQSQLDELAGCEEIGGSLRIDTFQGADLSPLASLRRVARILELGATPQPPLDVENPLAEDTWQEPEEMFFLESLHGLEALESVGTLMFDSLLVEDFGELANLRDVGSLFTGNMKNQKSFVGLEGLQVSALAVNASPALESLTGLRFSERPDHIIIEWAGVLKDAAALTDVRTIGILGLTGTGLEALPEFVELTATEIHIDNNAELVDTSSLAVLQEVVDFTVWGNPKLRSLPAFHNVRRIDSFSVIGNDSLEALTLDFPEFRRDDRLALDSEFEFSVSQIDIGMNASLRAITSPAVTPAVQLFRIYENASLTELDLGALERADLLSIDENPVLDSVTVPNLATVDSLQVTDNPQLSPEVFDPVQTFTRLISGNAPSAP